MRVRPTLLAAGLSAVALLSGAAWAEEAPKTTATSSTFFLAQEGCGATAEPGRLIPKATTSGATGCGTIGGLPLDEVLTQVEGSAGEPFTTTGKGLPIKLDAGRKITGELAASSWVGAGVGAGEVAFDITLTGVDVKGTKIDFGSTTATGSITPGEPVATAAYTLTVPATATAPMKSFTMTVVQRGANIGFSAKQLDGESYLVLPTKKK